jgi:outer membrane protein TolC
MVEFTKYESDAGDPGTRSRFNTMVKQEIPFPAVLGLKGDAATKEAELARVRYDAALRDAVGEAREAFLEVLYIDRAREATAANRGILARYAAEAAGDLASGRTKLPEEFRAESLLAQSGYDLVVLGDLRRAAEQRLRSDLALLPSAPLGPLVPDATGPLALSYEELLRLAETRNQEIAAAGIELEMAGIEERIASWEFAPTLTAGAEFMRNDMQDPALGTARNSRTVSLGFTIPFWFQGKTARVREAAAGTIAAGAERAATVEAVRAAVADLWVRASNTGRLVGLYDGTLLPQAEKSARLAEALHRKGKASLAGMLETATALQNFRLARARAEADHGQAIARLERVVGASVTAPIAADRPGGPEPVEGSAADGRGDR